MNRNSGNPRRGLRFETLERRHLLSADSLVAVDLVVVDHAGESVEEVEVGDQFSLRGVVRDLRDEPEGILGAWVDVTYDASLARMEGAVAVGDGFAVLRSGLADGPGAIDEVGGARTPEAIREMGGETIAGDVLFEIPFHAIAPGEIVFAVNPSEDIPAHETLLVGLDVPAEQDQIVYGYTRLQVGDPSLWPPSPWRNSDNPFDVDNDGEVTGRDAELIESALGENVEVPLGSMDSHLAPPPYLDTDGDGVVSQSDVGLVRSWFPMQSPDTATKVFDPVELEERFGSGVELELEVFNVRTNSPATTINVGDVIVVRIRESVRADGGTAQAYSFGLFLRTFVGLACETGEFSRVPRAYGLADVVDLPKLVGSVASDTLIVNEIGTITLASVAHAVPEDLTAIDPERVASLRSRPEIAAYLESAINHAVLDLEVVDGAQRPVANDDSYEFVWPSGSGGIADPAVEVSAADGVLANDSAPQGARLRAVVLDAPRHGRLQLNADGSFRYQPNRSLSGSDSFSYVAISEEGTSEPRTATIVGAYPPIVNVDLRALSPDGQPLTHVKIGDKFFVEMVASASDDSTMLQPLTAKLGYDTDVVMPAEEVEFNPEFGKLEFEIVTSADGHRSLESETVEPTGGLDNGSISMHVPGFRLEPIFHVEKQVFRIGFTADAAGDVEFEFTDFSTRSLDSHLFNLHSAVLTVRPGSVWQNPTMPLDVNADGIISPLDALVGINRLNGAEDGNLGEERSATDPDHTFPDTNGDGIHSALDILLIINELNEGMAAEGEAPVIADHTVGTNGSTREMWRPRNEQSSMAQVLPSVTRQPLQVQLAVSSLRQPSLDRLVNVEPYLVDLLAEDILSATL